VIDVPEKLLAWTRIPDDADTLRLDLRAYDLVRHALEKKKQEKV